MYLLNIWIFGIFHQFLTYLKLTWRLVTLFDYHLQVFKNFPNWPIFLYFWWTFFTQNVNVVRFARNVEWDFFCDFQTLCCFKLQKEDQSKGSLKLNVTFWLWLQRQFLPPFLFWFFWKRFHKVIRNPWPRTTPEAVEAILLGAELRIRINTVEVTLNDERLAWFFVPFLGHAMLKIKIREPM